MKTAWKDAFVRKAINLVPCNNEKYVPSRIKDLSTAKKVQKCELVKRLILFFVHTYDNTNTQKYVSIEIFHHLLNTTLSRFALHFGAN